MLRGAKSALDARLDLDAPLDALMTYTADDLAAGCAELPTAAPPLSPAAAAPIATTTTTTAVAPSSKAGREAAAVAAPPSTETASSDDDDDKDDPVVAAALPVAPAGLIPGAPFPPSLFPHRRQLHAQHAFAAVSCHNRRNGLPPAPRAGCAC